MSSEYMCLVERRRSSPNGKINEWLIKIGALIQQLTQNVSADPIERTPEQQARWVLANLLDFHRREQNAVWWEHYRLAALPAEGGSPEK